MGVKELWSILSPAKKEVSLDTLKGQTIAVDLSVWICENQGVKAVQGKVSKPHLRNLFFRISNLVQLGVTLVFVVDGDPPELKWETISNRINSRYKGRGRGCSANNRSRKPGRSHFKSQIKECLELLDCLGVPYVQSTGEAEALCALLNQEGIVDGCITEDGDVLLYGATTVYKNFNLTGKSPVIDCYNMADIERQLGLTREMLVALALLVGCDYVPKGVPGVGKVHALQLVSQFRGSNVLERFKRWVDEDTQFQLSLPSKPAHCTRCSHVGSAQKHKTEGCPQCGLSSSCTSSKTGSPCTCDWHRQKKQFDKSGPERDIMLKALQVPGFPQENVIQEFLNVKDKCPQHPLKLARPKMMKIMKFALDKLDWPEKYTREKVIDLVVFHDLQNSRENKRCKDILDVEGIVKRRIRNGVPCVEVTWKLPDAWKLGEDESDVISTIENLDLFKSVFPEVVEEFESKEASKKENKKGKKKKKATDVKVNDVTPSDERDALETVTDQLSGLMLQTDAKEADDASSSLVHTTSSTSGDRPCDTSYYPKTIDVESGTEGLCSHKRKVRECNASYTLPWDSLDHDKIKDKMFESFERKIELNSAEEGNIVQSKHDTVNQTSNSEWDFQGRRIKEYEPCSSLAITSEENDGISHRPYQSHDDSIIPSLAERLDLKRRQKVCEGKGKPSVGRKRNEFLRVQSDKGLGANFGRDETGGKGGLKEVGISEVDLNKDKEQKIEIMEERNHSAVRCNHGNYETEWNQNIGQGGKDLKQMLQNIKTRNLSRVVSGDCASRESGMTLSSTTFCPELFDISTPDLSLVDGTTTQPTIGQRNTSKNGLEMVSVCPEVYDMSTPNVTLIDREPSGHMDSQEGELLNCTKMERNLQVCKEIYDLCTPEVSIAICSDNEIQEPDCVSTVRLTDDSENRNSPLCSGSCDVIRAATFSSCTSTKTSFNFEKNDQFSEYEHDPLEPTELYDLCTPDVSVVGDLGGDKMTHGEDGMEDVIEISDRDEDSDQDQFNNCIQDGCGGLGKLHLSDEFPKGENGRSREREGGQQERSTPECTLWGEPTALVIDTPSQIIVRGTPSIVEGTSFTNTRTLSETEGEVFCHNGLHEVKDSHKTRQLYTCSHVRRAFGSDTLTVKEQCSTTVGDNVGLSPSNELECFALHEKSIDHSLFQKLNFSLGTSEWTFSPLNERYDSVGHGQSEQSNNDVEREKKYLNKRKSESKEVEDVEAHLKQDNPCVGSVFADEQLGGRIGVNETVIRSSKECDSYLKEVIGNGGKIEGMKDEKEPEGDSRNVLNKQSGALCEQLLMDQPTVGKIKCSKTGKKSLSSDNCSSIERKCEDMVGRGQGKGRGFTYGENYGDRVLMERSNPGNKYANIEKQKKENHKDGQDKTGEQPVFGRWSLAKEELTQECISQSCDTKIQKDLSNCGRGIDVCGDKENSPVSLMDRLRKKSARTRDILNSMEFD